MEERELHSSPKIKQVKLAAGIGSRIAENHFTSIALSVKCGNRFFAGAILEQTGRLSALADESRPKDSYVRLFWWRMGTAIGIL